jgi:GT2 family glycosyltransferase
MKYSILIVNYKSIKDVLILFEDIQREFKYQDYEVIVVENNSGDIFPSNILNTKVIYSKTNLGFGKGMNLAASYATGEFLVLINPDCRLPEGLSFDKFVTENIVHDFGVLAPFITYPSGEVQPNRGGRSNLKTYILQFFRLGQLRKFFPTSLLKFNFIKDSIVGKYLDNFKLIPIVAFPDWLSGAFMVIPNNVFKDVNGFDPNIFMYCEDEDICIRISSLGKKIVFSSSYRVIHEVGGTQKTGEEQRLKFAEIKRLESNIYHLSKHSGYFSANALKFIYSLFYFFFIFKFNRSSDYYRTSIHFFCLEIKKI